MGFHYFAPNRGGKYCEWNVSMSVSLLTYFINRVSKLHEHFLYMLTMVVA